MARQRDERAGSVGVEGLETLRADNRGPFTLDGTRTRLIGRDHLIVLDPGPDMDSHVRALSLRMGAAEVTTIALTHGLSLIHI